MRLLVASIALMATLAGSPRATTNQGLIAFSERLYDDGSDSWALLVVEPDGSGLRRVTRSGQRLSFDTTSPDWSPDGRRIVFQTNRGIAVIDADGKRLRQLTADGETPAWSPTGGRIAFARRGNGIWTMRADGQLQRRLTRNRSDDSPAWSPDGSRILFVRGRDLWVMGAHGGKSRRLVSRASSPSWSPRGGRIAFVDPSEGIVVVNADGTGRKRLEDGGDPTWSPDGRRIAFSYRGISVMDADGRNPRVILRGDQICCPTWGP